MQPGSALLATLLLLPLVLPRELQVQAEGGGGPKRSSLLSSRQGEAVGIYKPPGQRYCGKLNLLKLDPSHFSGGQLCSLPWCLKEKLVSIYVNCSPGGRLVRSMSNLVDESGTCQCVAHLPNNSILLEQPEKLQSAVQELFDKYEQELSRACEYVHAMEDKGNQALEMSNMREFRNPSAIVPSYETPAFNLLHLELKRMQELATQLMAKSGVNGSTDLLHQLQEQVTNASLTLRLLVDTEQSTRAFQQEVDVLEGRLSVRRKRSMNRPPDSLVHTYPLLNWRGLSYKAGIWGRDSAPNSTSSLYWGAPLRPDGRYFDYYRLHKSFDDLMLLNNYEEWKMGYGDGSGNTMYKNFMYFNYYGIGDMAKVDLSSNTLVLWHPLAGATYNNRFSYAGVPWKDIDFAGDEKGLWVLCATEQSKGNLVLYALRSLSTHQEEIFYAFDTTTGKETHLSILLDKMLETLHGINYCPSDHKLYVYNGGFLVNYDLTFPTLEHRLPRAPAPRLSGARAPPKPVKLNESSGVLI
ncbi:Olfactomedin-4 [Heterocephalus glaber]|uniref:Olfactomedin-4 n=1 Tax=Heterocephalus glaber TaxID=10181 RepID=G5BS51_HETGA|nr:Olfactomedin-4 [Heterocephalus glaber]